MGWYAKLKQQLQARIIARNRAKLDLTCEKCPGPQHCLNCVSEAHK